MITVLDLNGYVLSWIFKGSNTEHDRLYVGSLSDPIHVFLLLSLKFKNRRWFLSIKGHFYIRAFSEIEQEVY